MKNFFSRDFYNKGSILARLLFGFSLLVFLSACKHGKDDSQTKPLKKGVSREHKKAEKSRELKKGILQTQAGEATLDEMLEQVDLDTEKGQYFSAAQWLEKIIRRYPENAKVVEYRYKLAESYFLAKKYQLASEAFSSFAKFYPADEREGDARYFALMSKYNYSKSFSVECDSTPTKEVSEMCSALLADESMIDRKNEILAILNHCDERLLNKEVAVFDSYLRRKKFDSAEVKLGKIKSDFLAKNSTLEPRIVYLECKLAKKTNDLTNAQACLDQLLEKYPDSRFTRMASGVVNTDIGLVSELFFS